MYLEMFVYLALVTPGVVAVWFASWFPAWGKSALALCLLPVAGYWLGTIFC
jgi:hypothetical protein